MSFEIEPLGRHRQQHANATRRWVQDEAQENISPQCQQGFAAQGPREAPGGSQGSLALCLSRELDVEAILEINDNGVDRS